VTRRPLCAALSFGTSVSIDPAFYARQIEDIKRGKVTDRLVVRFDHVQEDTRWGTTVRETMAVTGRFSSICVLVMGGTPAIPSEFAEYLTNRHDGSSLDHLELIVVGVDAQVDAMTMFLKHLAKMTIDIKQVALGFSWFHPRAEDNLDRLSRAICSIVESPSCTIDALQLSKIRFKPNKLGQILRSVENNPLDLEISGFIGTKAFWSTLEGFSSSRMLALSPYSGSDFPVATLLGNRRNLSSLSIDLSRCGHSHSFQPSLLIEAFRNNTSVHTLSLRGCQDAYQLTFLTRLLPTLRNVKHLEWEFIDYDHSRGGQWPTASIVDAFRKNFSVQTFVLHRHRKETDVDEYSLLSPKEEAQIQNCLNRNKAMSEWEKNPFAMPREYLPRVVAVAMANGNVTFTYQLLRELNVGIGPVF
jgi:hypothetical protein